MRATCYVWLFVLVLSRCDVGQCSASTEGQDTEVHCAGHTEALGTNLKPWRVTWLFEPDSEDVSDNNFIIDYNFETNRTDKAKGTLLHDRIKILTEGDSKYSLFIKSFSARDNGKYKCRIYGRGFRLLYTTTITLPKSMAPMVIGAIVAVIFVAAGMIAFYVYKRHQNKVARMALQDNSYTHLKKKCDLYEEVNESPYELIDENETRKVEHTAYEHLSTKVVDEGQAALVAHPTRPAPNAPTAKTQTID